MAAPKSGNKKGSGYGHPTSHNTNIVQDMGPEKDKTKQCSGYGPQTKSNNKCSGHHSGYHPVQFQDYLVPFKAIQKP